MDSLVFHAVGLEFEALDVVVEAECHGVTPEHDKLRRVVDEKCGVGVAGDGEGGIGEDDFPVAQMPLGISLHGGVFHGGVSVERGAAWRASLGVDGLVALESI